MIKLMAMFKLREGIDPDAHWKFWEEVHAPPHSGPGLVKYCINRVIQVVDGEPKYWGIAELWYESEEAQRKLRETGKMDRAMEAEKLLPGGGWFDRITDHDVVIVEEKVIVEDGVLLKK